MGRQSQSAAWSTAVVMGLKVTLGCLLACSVSSVPLDAGYGVPAAPLILASPHQPASLPHQLVHPAPQPVPLPPLIHNHAQPIFHSAPQPLIHPLPVAPAPFVPEPLPLFQEPQFLAPAPIPAPIQAPSSQFHAQDEFGQFSFGYENINSAKTETKGAFGVTRGSYQYIDANGIVQTVNYIADDINGFRVAGTNIPTAPGAAQPVAPAALPLVAPVPVLETPEVAAARAEHLAAHAEAKATVDAANAKEEEL